jgi:transcriptional regulator with XRE-family HTH domain
MDTPAKTLGALLRRLRDEREMTQKQVARNLGISQSALSAWESGQTLPPRPQMERIATVYGVPVETLATFFEKAETEESYAPHSLGRIHVQADEHVKRFGPDNLSVWILGATNLSVMERPFVQERWRANMLRGINYNVIWFLDLIPEETIRAAIAIFAQMERRTAAEYAAQDGTRPRGFLSHYATNAFDPPSDLMIALYSQFEQALGGGREAGKGKGRVHPYVAAVAKPPQVANAAVADAAKKVLRCWQPDTGIVFYRPKSVTTPPAANIRLMPVSEQIVDGLSPDAEQSHYWLWLSPRGAARLNNAVAALDEAIRTAEAGSASVTRSA